MANLQLSLILGNNPRTQPIIDGSVKPDGIDLAITVAHPSEIFWRQLSYEEFDISEMSMSSFLIITAGGDKRWVALPVFTSRMFFHTWSLVRADSGISKPADLKGKRIGVPEYQQTAALWARGVLQNEFSVSPSDMDWWMERTEERSHGGHTGFTPPTGVRFNRIPAEKSMASMLLSGELDASLLYIGERNLVDRSGVDLSGNPAIRTLFPDPAAEGVRYYQKTGIFPINHGMVVKRSLLEQHPWVAINLYKAFAEARDQVAARTRELAGVYFDLGLLPADQRAAIAADPYPYGVKANLKVLETIAEYSHEQGLTPRVMKLDEVFAPSTLEL
ncbi:MAG TPA: PhnD/SsuA/transferrin family substrate-binding protein [Dehalococcoidia bacterium]|nr:PhnD/SsuA/transferrin family substrate-binding protein [Dehalococcoidia bacterium]